jgi:hypothetical protein
MLGTQVRTHNPVASASWDRDVEPLARAHCFSCHRPGGSASPVLASVEDFRTHRQAVKQAVISRRMPPWSAVRGFGAFNRDRSLSPLQVSLIASWIEAGAAGSRTTPDGTILSDKLVEDTAHVDQHRTLELPPFATGQSAQRDVLNYAGAGPVAIIGWRFIPGSASIGQARVSDSGRRLLWAAPLDFGRELYPLGTGVVLNAPFRLTVESFRKSDKQDDRRERVRSKPSHLEVYLSSKRIVALRTVHATCESQSRVKGMVYGLRPHLSNENFLEVRSTSRPPQVLGLFRGPTNDSRTYWLRTPTVIGDKNLTVHGENCAVDIVVAPSRSRISS